MAAFFLRTGLFITFKMVYLFEEMEAREGWDIRCVTMPLLEEVYTISNSSALSSCLRRQWIIASVKQIQDPTLISKVSCLFSTTDALGFHWILPRDSSVQVTFFHEIFLFKDLTFSLFCSAAPSLWRQAEFLPRTQVLICQGHFGLPIAFKDAFIIWDLVP
jgi:hypothetical protein